MAEPDDFPAAAAFLSGGGAAAALIARHDWASTPLGPLSAWPQSLCTTVAIVLRSPMPMTLQWGPDGVLIYNDAYARMTAAHNVTPPMGCRAREAWRQVADFDEIILKPVLAGETLSHKDVQPRDLNLGIAELFWLNVDFSPVLDESGRPAGALGVIVETTDRKLAELRAHANIERQRRLYEAAPGFIMLTSGPEHVIDFVNGTFRDLFGERHPIGKPLAAAFPDFGPQASVSVNRVFTTGERAFHRAVALRFRKAAGAPLEEHYVDFVIEPLTGEGAEVTGVFVEGFEVTDQVLAQAAVRHSEQRLSAALDLAGLGTFEWDLETHGATLDERAREIFGFGRDEVLLVEDVNDRIDPGDAVRLREETAAFAAEHRARREFEYVIQLPDGTSRDIVSVSDAVMGPDGRPRRVIGVFADVTDRRRAETRQQLLINELNHRVKNTLATVQSIAAQTLRSTGDPHEARDAFEARLVALAAAHDLLTAQSWHGARLADVAASAMAPFLDGPKPQIDWSGPPVWVSAQHALALSLALHELATNAVKYGALSTPAGCVTIRWTQGADGQLCIAWVEAGGPPVAPPTRVGFGSRLLQRGLAHDLHGEVELTYPPEGVQCHIRCKLEEAPPPPPRAFAAL
jgi:PAS domain S-box-containing protein